jgi:hypothetical protein
MCEIKALYHLHCSLSDYNETQHHQIIIQRIDVKNYMFRHREVFLHFGLTPSIIIMQRAKNKI